MSELLRHIAACNNAILPGGRRRLHVGGEPVGWVAPEVADRIARLGVRADAAGLHAEPDALTPIARDLADAGLTRWRKEAFDVRSASGRPPVGQIDRGALPALGIRAEGVHVNGLVGDRLWIARRAADKALDPGKLDHLVAGGIAAGDTASGTLVKEGAEEAGLPAALARTARRVGTIAYAMERTEGLRRDLLSCWDLELPADFQPEPQDGEVEAFELWELDRVLETVRSSDRFKFNVNLVLIDLFLRRGLVHGAEAETVRAALDRPRPED